ncbi:hypothetical protein [Lysobacter sp. yr284]|uniref:hypothetical protein n=1 Tax=Lysobacter sp. yr284 TaxID=1761791 RepID=UPI00111359C4|nr:hypothetical protein [Lysobacter sp. yr284]
MRIHLENCEETHNSDATPIACERTSREISGIDTFDRLHRVAHRALHRQPEAPKPEAGRTAGCPFRSCGRVPQAAHSPPGERDSSDITSWSKQFMYRTKMKLMAAAVFAMGLAIGGIASAQAPVPGQSCSPNGRSVNDVKNGWRYYYRCTGGKWILEKVCPVGGGICYSP